VTPSAGAEGYALLCYDANAGRLRWSSRIKSQPLASAPLVLSQRYVLAAMIDSELASRRSLSIQVHERSGGKLVQELRAETATGVIAATLAGGRLVLALGDRFEAYGR
jgi:hypothetical protein